VTRDSDEEVGLGLEGTGVGKAKSGSQPAVVPGRPRPKEEWLAQLRSQEFQD